jgi:hypothetical protein
MLEQMIACAITASGCAAFLLLFMILAIAGFGAFLAKTDFSSRF